MSSNFCIHRRAGTLCWPIYLNEIVCRRKGRRARGEPPAGLVFSFFGSVYSISSSKISLTKICIYLFKTASPLLSARTYVEEPRLELTVQIHKAYFPYLNPLAQSPKAFFFLALLYVDTSSSATCFFQERIFHPLICIHLSRVLRSQLPREVKMTLLKDDECFLKICCRA